MNIALIGNGYWGSKLKRYIEENEFFTLSYVCDSTTGIEHILNDDSIRAVVVATPNATHYDIVKACLSNGKHVLSEKPLATKKEQCIELRDIAKANNVFLETEYTYTYSKAVGMARSILSKEDNIGIDMSVKHLGRFGGGSVYWLLGSHMLSILDTICDIDDLSFSSSDIYADNGAVETGDIYFKGEHINGRIGISLNHPEKDVSVSFYCDGMTLIYRPLCEESLVMHEYDKSAWVVAGDLNRFVDTWKCDETNNLKFSIENFEKVVKGEVDSNINSAIKITGVLEEISKR